MKYTVAWKTTAEDDLLEIWLATADRQVITDCMNRIEQALSTSPLQCGESRSAATRIMFEDPLGVFYDVSEADRLVTVLKVWII